MDILQSGQAALLWLAEVILLFLLSTIVFDVVHVLLHRLEHSSRGGLRAIAGWHATHHRFLGPDLQIDPAHQDRNLRRHVVPEYLTQLGVSLLAAFVLPLSLVLPVIALQTLVFGLILRARGLDVNHRSIARLDAYRPLYFCLPEYHALHHIRPDAHFSSWIKTLDHALGTGLSLTGRRVAMTGADTALGRALRAGLEQRTGMPVVEIAASREAVQAACCDVLLLAHSPELPEDYEPLIAAQREAHRAAARPPEVCAEVWVVARRPGRASRRHFFDPHLVYRHVALPAGVAIDARRAARAALSGLFRGFNFVPAGLGWQTLPAWLAFRYGTPPPTG